jgi:hypothetical protein
MNDSQAVYEEEEEEEELLNLRSEKNGKKIKNSSFFWVEKQMHMRNA